MLGDDGTKILCVTPIRLVPHTLLGVVKEALQDDARRHAFLVVSDAFSVERGRFHAQRKAMPRLVSGVFVLDTLNAKRTLMTVNPSVPRFL